MKILKKVNQYMKSGSIIFVYTLEGDAKELAAYKASQGEYYRESDTDEPLYFSQRICTVGAELTETKSGRFQVLQDLEGVATKRAEYADMSFGKLTAIQQFAGLTKAQMTERLLATF